MRVGEFLKWLVSKLVGALLAITCFYGGFFFPGGVLWFYITNASIEAAWEKFVFLIGVGISSLFWYGVYRTTIGRQSVDSVLGVVVNLAEHGHWKGRDSNRY